MDYSFEIGKDSLLHLHPIVSEQVVNYGRIYHGFTWNCVSFYSNHCIWWTVRTLAKIFGGLLTWTNTSMYTEQYHILEGTIWTQILILLGSHMDTFLRSFGVFLLVKCCGSFNKFNTYFLRSLNSRLFFRLWIFYMVRQRGTHFCRLFYWSVRYPVTPITQIRDQLGNLTAKRTQQVSFDLLILI